MANFEKEVWNSIIASYESEYKDLCENWKIVETKAQSTLTLSSVMLAAAFAFARELPDSFNVFHKCLFCAAILSLALCVSTAVWSLRIRSLGGPPLGGSAHKILEDLSRRGIYTQEERYFKTLSDNWKANNDEVSENIDDKSSIIGSAQICLAWAGGLFVFLTISAITG